MHTVYSRYIGLCLFTIIENPPINNSRVKRDLEIQDYRPEPEKQIDSLPVHAKHIFKKTHDSAVEQYQDPEKRRPIELV